MQGWRGAARWVVAAARWGRTAQRVTLPAAEAARLPSSRYKIRQREQKNAQKKRVSLTWRKETLLSLLKRPFSWNEEKPSIYPDRLVTDRQTDIRERVDANGERFSVSGDEEHRNRLQARCEDTRGHLQRWAKSTPPLSFSSSFFSVQTFVLSLSCQAIVLYRYIKTNTKGTVFITLKH